MNKKINKKKIEEVNSKVQEFANKSVTPLFEFLKNEQDYNARLSMIAMLFDNILKNNFVRPGELFFVVDNIKHNYFDGVLNRAKLINKHELNRDERMYG